MSGPTAPGAPGADRPGRGTVPAEPDPAVPTDGDVRWDVVPPTCDVAQQVLTEYFDDIVGRYWGRAATPAEVTSAMADEPSDDLQGASGLLLVGTVGETPIACGGVRLAEGTVGDLTRIFVAPAARGRRLGVELVRRLERLAWEAGVRMLRLDVRADLAQARSLYQRLGFVDVPRFSDARYADHWMAKELTAPAQTSSAPTV